MDTYKRLELEKDLYYGYSKILSALTLADIKDWNRVIDLLIIVSINAIREHNLLITLKNDSLNQKEPRKDS